MAPRFRYIKKLSETALRNIQLLNVVRRVENERIINDNKINFKSLSSDSQKLDLTDVDLKKDFN